MTGWTGSEFEVRKIGIEFESETEGTTMECIGSLEEEMETKTVTKKCRGVIKKRRVRGTGAGTLKLSAHIPYDIYVKAMGMELPDDFEDFAFAYGQDSVHKEFVLTAIVYDEDDNRKLKAYPKCVITNGIARKIENGAEEVAEIELEIAVMPDENGRGLYEMVGDDTTIDDTMIDSWLKHFTTNIIMAP